MPKLTLEEVKPNERVPTQIRLHKTASGSIIVEGIYDGVVQGLVAFTESGKLRRIGSISSELGFQLDEAGRVLVD